jgi:hypothetical protein
VRLKTGSNNRRLKEGRYCCGKYSGKRVLKCVILRWMNLPFWPDSDTALAQLLEDVSREPPIEWTELAVEPLLAVGCG